MASANQYYINEDNTSEVNSRNAFLTFRSQSFVFLFAIQNTRIEVNRIVILLFYVGVKIGLSR